ncbi:MAG TPA: uracil phosphoribosyltransferase [Acidimicrobiales bacterium]|nr:uracil phosphoribosyltransferase [Acidimicrobiales bacterium]
MSNVLLVDHPVVVDRVTRMRDATTNGSEFRQLLAEVSVFLAYEALGDLELSERIIDTPVAAGVRSPVVGEPVLLVPVLRAGLGMVQAIQELLPLTRVAHVGLRRDEDTHEAELYLNRLPEELAGQRVVVCDPMLATGGSLATVCSLATDRGADSVTALCLIASEPGLEHFHAVHPGVRVVCAAIDPELNANAFIVPGLGDAGDRLFGPP